MLFCLEVIPLAPSIHAHCSLVQMKNMGMSVWHSFIHSHAFFVGLPSTVFLRTWRFKHSTRFNSCYDDRCECSPDTTGIKKPEKIFRLWMGVEPTTFALPVHWILFMDTLAVIPASFPQWYHPLACEIIFLTYYEQLEYLNEEEYQTIQMACFSWLKSWLLLAPQSICHFQRTHNNTMC